MQNKTKTFITNGFTLNMVENPLGKYEVLPCNWAEVEGHYALLNKQGGKEYNGRYVDIVNCFGHDKTIDIIKNKYGIDITLNRISVSAKRGDTIIVLQYKGERLSEGATELPQGAEIVPYKILII